MPELPEVEMARRYLEDNIVGHRVIDVEVKDVGVLSGIEPSQLRERIVGRTFEKAMRHGKQLFVMMDDGNSLTIHLGMTGELSIVQGDDDRPYTRALFRLEGGSSLDYIDQRKFGTIGICGPIDSFLEVRSLGPDALEIPKDEFITRIRAHRRAIKAVLLDQSVLAGIGNLYADEVLFGSRIHPMSRADELTPGQLGSLHRLVGEVLRKSIEIGSDFSSLPAGYLLRSRRAGSECPRGNGILTSMKVNGRTTILCLKCQPER
jgi:formamidopyrimidine-DNA glycosylase